MFDFRELKLRSLVIDNFIPLSEREKVKSRVTWDEEEGVWKTVEPLPSSSSKHQRPVSTYGARRPVSEYARLAAAVENNPRFRVRLYMIFILF